MNRNAIIMAAGMSTRFVPLSMETPKALLRVKGEILIERQIEQLHEAGIREIVVVVGYLKEKFQYLEEKYGVILVENSLFRTKNNHSTLYVARKYLKNTFICSGDNYFTENVFLEETTEAYYASVFEADTTDEWCLDVDKDGRITQVQIGGKDSWVMKGHVYFNEEFSRKIIPYLSEAYSNEEKSDLYWEEIFMEHLAEMKMYIHKYSAGIIEEFDSIEELRDFDQTYVLHSGNKVLEEICEKLNCQENEIVEIRPIKKEGEVSGFEFSYQYQKYSYLFCEGLGITEGGN